MRYLVKARLKPGMADSLLQAVNDRTLGRGSVAGDEYLHDLTQARLLAEGEVVWVEVCFCNTPLQEEWPYWEEYFDILEVKDAHARGHCRHENGTESWACCDCDCTKQLEEHLSQKGSPFLEKLRQGCVRGRQFSE